MVFLQNFLISTTTWNMSCDDTKFLRSYRNYHGENHNSLRVEFMKRETTTIDREGRNSVHVVLYEKKIYSHAVGVQLKRFTNRNSWLSINRCLFLTSLPARSVGDILMTSRIPASKANEPLRGFVLSNEASYNSHEHRKKMFGHNSCLNLSRNFNTVIKIKQKEDVYAKIKEIQRKASSIRFNRNRSKSLLVRCLSTFN